MESIETLRLITNEEGISEIAEALKYTGDIEEE